MAHLRDFLGQTCPHCARDILQQAPSTNRMPGQELAWCPTCHATLSVAQLEARPGRARAGGLIGRLFGKPQRG